ncbi:MAG: PepSY domain-containing protein [Robiginitomaculum sp.]|nr:PepSY domain-containing protein [Robiginitomaculum sp.]
MNRTLFRWHRRIGITSALFVLVLAVTGLLLLLSSPLKLDTKKIRGGWIANAYHLAPQTEPIGVEIGSGVWIVSIDNLVYIDKAPPIILSSPLLAVAKQESMFELVTHNELIVVLPDGQIVERLTRNSEAPINGLKPSQLPANILAQTLRRYSGEGLPASRVLLDIHTGRIFGKLGPWIMGLSSLLLIALSLSGIFMWSTAGKRRRRRERLEKQASKRADQSE